MADITSGNSDPPRTSKVIDLGWMKLKDGAYAHNWRTRGGSTVAIAACGGVAWIDRLEPAELAVKCYACSDAFALFSSPVEVQP